MAEDKNLEKIIYQSWIYYWPYITIVVLSPFIGIITVILFTAILNIPTTISIAILITSLLISFITYIYVWINRSSNKLYIYKDKILYETGFLNKNYKEIRKKDIRTIEVEQPFIHRLLNIGTLKIASAATGGYEIIFKGAKKPNEIKDEIEQSAKKIREEEKKKKEEEKKKKLENEKVVKRKLKKNLRFVKKIERKKSDDTEEEDKKQVKIYLKVYK